MWPLKFSSGSFKASAELWTVLRTQTRQNHNRPNLQRPLPLHYKRARMLAVVKPQYPPPLRICDKITREEKRNEGLADSARTPTGIEKNGYALFVAKKMRDMFHNHPMIAIMHMNSFTGHEFLKARGIFFDAQYDMAIENRLGRAVCRQALEGTKFEPVLQLLQSRCSVGYCKTTDVSKLLKLLKKTPQYILIGLILEDRLLQRADIEAYAKLPNKTTLYSNLSRTLTLASSNISNNLQANQILLSRSLAQHSSSSDS